MVRHLSAVLVAIAALGADASAAERSYTIRGDGWFDGGNPRFGRLAMREARLTLRDNGEFAVTLFVRGERYLVRGRWDRRGRGDVERIAIDNAFARRASGSGTLHYRRNGEAPERLVLEGRTSEGTFHADISDERGDGWDDPVDRGERRRGLDLGRGTRLYRDIDARTTGDGLLRMSGIRDGRLTSVRVRMGRDRDVRLDFERPTRGTVRAEITDIRDDHVVARVTDVYGARATGEVVIVMRDQEMVDRINGSGGGGSGSWQLDFDGRSRGRDDGWSDGEWGRGGGFESDDRGSGWLRQDVGPSLSFDRMTVSLSPNRDAVVHLEGRRRSVRLHGRWSGTGDRVSVELSGINEKRARGRLALRRYAGSVTALEGNGQTDLGRFEVRFTR
jgi:translation initiation factor IF-1